MTNIAIYNGINGPISGSTPHGFYDTDSQFQTEGPKFADFCARRLGYPLVDIELQTGSFYAALENAITVYGNEVYMYKIRENYLSLEGNTTGSNLNNSLINPSLGGTIRIAENYGAEAGSGGNVTYYTGSIDLITGQQTYNLNAWASASASLSAGDSIEIKRIFFEGSPAIVRYFDPYAGTGTGLQSLMETFGFGQFSPGINFMLMPMFFDVLKIQAIELNDQIRKSSFSFELVNNQLRIFPIPTFDRPLTFHYIKKSERDNVLKDTRNNIITNISNVPYQNPVYSNINTLGRQWIREYGLAISKEILGYIRGKYQSIPTPNEAVTLNSNDLITSAKDTQDALLTQLRLMLDEVSRNKQLEKISQNEDFLQKTLMNIPLTIYIG